MHPAYGRSHHQTYHFGVARLLWILTFTISTCSRVNSFSPSVTSRAARPTETRRLSLSIPGPIGLESGKDSAPGPWKPSTLPRLTQEELKNLNDGNFVQRQTRNGVVGSGFVVMDVETSSEAVWSLLTDYQQYPSMIQTVKSAFIRPGPRDNSVRAKFILSKFLLEVNVIHEYNPKLQLLRFFLDGTSRNMIMKEADGYWFVESGESAEALKPGHVRVWFGASIRVSRLVPPWVVDYAAQRALRRATSWLPLAAKKRHKALVAKAAKDEKTEVVGVSCKSN